jgi:hypothetical protein
LERINFLSFLFLKGDYKEDLLMDKYFYIYNPIQSNFFLKMGIPALEVGKGNNGNFYVKFPRNEASEMVFTVWCERRKST